MKDDKKLLNEKLSKRLKNRRFRKRVSFHMPGHKFGQKIPRYIKRNLLAYDTTELSYSDNLMHPENVLKNFLDRARIAYGSKKIFFSSCGATLCIFVAIKSAFKEGDIVLVSKDCHLSVHNALLEIKAKPVYVSYEVDRETSRFVMPKKEMFISYMDSYKPKGIIFTSPNYFGQCQDLSLIEEAKNRGLLVIVDEAHGALFPFSKNLPKSANEFSADFVIQSLHKTMPAIGQSALLHLNNLDLLENVKKYYSIFHTSSPSYMMMTMADYAISYMLKNGEKRIEKLLHWRTDLLKCLKRLPNIQLVDTNDPLRMVFDVYETGYSGFEVAKFLEKKYNIYVEMSDLCHIVLIVTTSNVKSDFSKLMRALKTVSQNSKEKSFDRQIIVDAFNVKDQMCDTFFEKMVIPYPPGFLVAMKGDLKTKEMVRYLELIEHYGGDIYKC